VFVQEPDTPFSTLRSQSAQYDNELLVISESDIISKLDKINKYKSLAPDCIYPRILYELRYNISYPLMLIFNCSLRNNKLPEDWRCANVTAIYKKGSKSEVNNYRPVSLTSNVCKILESFIRDPFSEK